MIAAAELINGSLVAARVLSALAGVCLFAGTSVAGDPLQPDTVWKGEINQGNNSFPATVYIQHREGDRIKGEIDFETTGGSNKLALQGDVVGSDMVVWITDKIAGAVTYPGLYIGRIEGDRISGTWQVPSAGQYDQFSLSLVQ